MRLQPLFWCVSLFVLPCFWGSFNGTDTFFLRESKLMPNLWLVNFGRISRTWVLRYWAVPPGPRNSQPVTVPGWTFPCLVSWGIPNRKLQFATSWESWEGGCPTQDIAHDTYGKMEWDLIPTGNPVHLSC